jgi:hypothetical protein
MAIPQAYLTQQEQRWIVYVQWYGWGPDSEPSYDFVFSTSSMGLAGGERVALLSFPGFMPESLEPDGGVPQLGEVTFELTDTEGDILSSYRPSAPPIGALIYDAPGGTFIVPSTTTIPSTNRIWVGDIPWTVTSQSISGSENTLTCDDWEDDANNYYYAGQKVYGACPNVVGSRIQLRIAPAASATPQADSYLVGNFVTTAVAFSDGGKRITFTASSQLAWLYRSVGEYNRLEYNVDGVQAGGTAMTVTQKTPFDAHSVSTDWSPTTDYFKVSTDGETAVEMYSVDDRNFSLMTKYVGGYSTSTIEAKNTLKVVMCADKACIGGSDFKYSPGTYFGGTASSSRTSGTWTGSSNLVDILLCIMTSKYHADDWDANYSSTYGNWQSLPSGFGLSIRQTDIDMDSFMEVRSRTRGVSFDGFMCGYEPETFAKAVTEKLLKPVGCSLTTDGGLIRLVLPRPVGYYSLSFALDSDSIMALGTGSSGVVERDLSHKVSGAGAVNSVTVETSSRKGGTNRETFRTGADRTRIASPSSSKVISSPAMLTEKGSATMALIATRRLNIASKPSTTITARLPMSKHEILPGDIGTITDTTIVDAVNGAMGATDLRVECVSRSVEITPTSAEINMTLVAAEQSVNVGLIAPSFYVVYTSGTYGYTANNNTPNRFTTAYSETGGAQTDTTHFEVGDKLKLVSEDGDVITAVTDTVVSKTSSTIETAHGFGGDLASGMVITIAGRASHPDVSYEPKHVMLADKYRQAVENASNVWDQGELWSWGDI